MFRVGGYFWGWVYPGGGYTRGVRYTKGGGQPERMGMFTPKNGTWDTYPQVLTPSGSHHDMYDWQVDGTQLTKMLLGAHFIQ